MKDIKIKEKEEKKNLQFSVFALFLWYVGGVGDGAKPLSLNPIVCICRLGLAG